MQRSGPGVMLFTMILVLVLATGKAEAGYFEGVDTTDSNGYALNSAFRVTAIGTITSSTSAVSCYGLAGGEDGLFNFSFNDIKTACALNGLPNGNFPHLAPGCLYSRGRTVRMPKYSLWSGC